MTYELHQRPVLGTNYIEHRILVNGVLIYSQIGPFSDAEIDDRVTRYLRSAAPAEGVKDAWRRHSKPGPKGVKSYDWRTAKPETTNDQPEGE